MKIGAQPPLIDFALVNPRAGQCGKALPLDLVLLQRVRHAWLSLDERCFSAFGS